MGQNQYVVAIEIGSTKIVGALAEKTPTGVQVRFLEKEKLANCVRFGAIQNPDIVKSNINAIVAKLENAIDGEVKNMFVGVSGRSVHSMEVTSEHSLDSSQPITAEMLKEYLSSMAKNPPKGYEIIDIVPKSIKVDNKETVKPVGQFGSKLSICVNLILAKEMVKLNLIRALGDRQHTFVTTPLAVGKEVLKESEMSLGCMLVDMGAETTTVSIYKNAALCYLMTLPLGGLNLTKDVAMGSDVMEEDAEIIKQNLSSPLDPKADDIEVGGVSSSKAATLISARMGEIITNIKEQLTYAKMSADDVKSVVLVGGGAQLKGLQEKMQDELKLPVRLGEYPSSVVISDHHINKPEYIELLSLLSTGAKKLEAGESCVERVEYVDGPVFGDTDPQPVITPQQPVTPAAESGKKEKSGGGSFLKKMWAKASVLLDENDKDE